MGWLRSLLILAGLLGGGLLLAAMRMDPGPVARPVSGHFDGEYFSLPGGRQIGDKSLADVWQWQRTREPAHWPDAVPVAPVIPESRVAGGRLAATMVGHATVLLQTEGLNILTDPIWSERASPFSFLGPKRVTEPGIRFDDLPKIDLVVVSHGHWDHLDLPTLKRLWARDRPLILVPPGHGRLLAEAGVEARELDWGERARLGAVTAVAEPVYHWTSRWFLDRNRALWAGWTLIAPGGNIYFAGDSGYGDGAFFRAAKRHGPVRLALLPVGAYEPRWFMAEQHMNPAEAVQAFADLGAEQALGLHWGTFQLTDEGREAPRVELRAALEAAGIARLRFPALEAGEVLRMDAPPVGLAGGEAGAPG
ncbi:MBL fold metallo-hydrolase [Sandaracinobacter sp. RS1-74]|uniref:MBL fold metallo-hydrolase n=1 Tax=Sandaracinobacteroides sayramensis TaxID=2913411 RepID=UPI001EDB66D6|nr:MBL fold metallo-hydrolase [Sandaracinobacteroides sayramensis]MCG2841413.1 MBL fold metallo-hydrolase [Sandaracinobacteroides sayramensis]